MPLAHVPPNHQKWPRGVPETSDTPPDLLLRRSGRQDLNLRPLPPRSRGQGFRARMFTESVAQRDRSNSPRAPRTGKGRSRTSRRSGRHPVVSAGCGTLHGVRWPGVVHRPAPLACHLRGQGDSSRAGGAYARKGRIVGAQKHTPRVAGRRSMARRRPTRGPGAARLTFQAPPGWAGAEGAKACRTGRPLCWWGYCSSRRR